MDQPDPSSMHGKVCLITGATRGLGLATALGLAIRGANVVIVGRDPRRINIALQYLHQYAPQCEVHGLRADLSSLQAVRGMVKQFQQRYPGLDVLINNVGGVFLQYQRTVDGFERTWALNYLSQYLTTRLLMEQLQCAVKERGAARVVGITSSMYRFSKAVFPPKVSEHRFNGVAAYALSKRAMILFTRDIAQRYCGTGITFNTITPGFVATEVASNNHGWGSMAMRILRYFSAPLDKGVLPILHLATAQELQSTSGQYFVKFQQRPPDKSCHDPIIQQQLWRMSSEMTFLPE